MSFQVSDKIVCIRDTDAPQIKEGTTYVVRDMYPPDQDDPRWGVYLVGVKGDIHFDGREVPFAADRFRKLTDIQAENRAKAYYGASFPQFLSEDDIIRFGGDQ